MPGSFSKGIPGVPARYFSMPLNPSRQTAVTTEGLLKITNSATISGGEKVNAWMRSGINVPKHWMP
jgi:hypothetical protein